MNVYDFDGTIYDGDSSVDYWLYSIRKKPSVFLKCLPELFCGALLYGLKRIPKEKWKEHFFSFLRSLPADDTRVTRTGVRRKRAPAGTSERPKAFFECCTARSRPSCHHRRWSRQNHIRSLHHLITYRSTVISTRYSAQSPRSTLSWIRTSTGSPSELPSTVMLYFMKISMTTGTVQISRLP